MTTKHCLFGAVVCLLASVTDVVGAARYHPDPWEKQVVAACLVLEASSDGETGMIAVANVIENRGKDNPRNYYRVVKTPYAFSSLNKATTGHNHGRGFTDAVRRASRDHNWQKALKIVDRLYAGRLHDLTHGATHFSLRSEHVAWMRKMEVTAIIGDHKFMKSPLR